MRGNIYKTLLLLLIAVVSSIFSCCRKDTADSQDNQNSGTQYNTEQAISDEAQRNTISFDGLAFLTGNLGAQSFLPPGKVADYSGFQFLRDNDPTALGHNTSFVTIVAINVLNVLSSDQVQVFVGRAQSQVDQINDFAYKRFPLLKAFRRLQEGDLPQGTTELDKDAVMSYAADLYELDGRISYDRAKVFGIIAGSLSASQKEKFQALKALNGVGHWDSTLSDPLQPMNLPHDVNVAVMTYASEFYAWYTGNVTSDVYFCPERHGTYFGSFFLKDWPAMGNPNYTINETLTASAGQDFLAALPASLADEVKNIVNLQRSALLEIVQKREAIATELRKFLSSQAADSSLVMSLSRRYGELDGELSYYYATTFTQVYNALTADQRDKIASLAEQLGYLAPEGAFLYSEPVEMPQIPDTDFMFQ